MATDAELSAQVDQFLTAKALYGCTEDARTQQKAFEELGLYEDPKTHIQLETTYAKWKQIQQSQKKLQS